MRRKSHGERQRARRSIEIDVPRVSPEENRDEGGKDHHHLQEVEGCNIAPICRGRR